MERIQTVTTVPAAFEALATAINACVSVCNAVLKMQGRNGLRVTIADQNIVIDIPADGTGDAASGNTIINQISALPPAPSSGTWVLGSVGGVMQWIDTEDC